ncbi:hypothetical protein [Streptomyces virginiae]|uniref:hypothetical protein n=1 Tax=Streptomyces virginiae TaxID=1961 RepID=UPI003253B0C0
MIWDASALHRLLRWAEQTPTPEGLRPGFRNRPRPKLVARRRTTVAPTSAPASADSETVRLAATTLLWTLTSSNRFLRDRATKALVQLLLGHPRVLSGLIDTFLGRDAAEVDDPYLFERLTLVAYGVLARLGEPPEQVRGLAEQMLAYVYGDVDAAAHASRNALLCDAAGRIVAMGREVGVISNEEADRTRHPHACPEVGQPHAEADEETLFPWRDLPANASWRTLHASLGGLGDFARYETSHAVGHFSLLPLATARPRHVWERRDDAPILDPSGIPDFTQSLPTAAQPALGTCQAVQALLAKDGLARSILDDEQHSLLQACRKAAPPDERLADARVDPEWAARWILSRVATLGWSPERFGEFDSFRSRGNGSRSSHKAERIGKKYQWMALHELIERLANNHHMRAGSVHDPDSYPGAARLSLLDVDPTLPPATHPFESTSNRDDTVHTTFRPTTASEFWVPPGALLPAQEELAVWIAESTPPDLTALATRHDPVDGRTWVVLDEFVSDDQDERRGSGGRAEQWHLIQSWTVPEAQHPATMRYLHTHPLTGRWMPQPSERHSLYLAQFPTSPSSWNDPEPSELAVENRAVIEDSEARDEAAHDVQPPALDGELDKLLALYLPPIPETDREDHAGKEAGRDLVEAWRERRRARGQHQLLKLAHAWKSGPVDYEDGAERLLSQTSNALPRDRATGPGGKPVAATPASQNYSWDGQGHDCSIDESVHVVMPSDTLLRASGLRQDPDGGCWYDSAGYMQAQYRTFHRPNGKVHTLLVEERWLTARLDRLQLALIQGIIGELQTVDDDPDLALREWKEFSQIASLKADGTRKTRASISRIRRPS